MFYKTFFKYMVLIAVFIIPASSMADIYKYVDKNGKVHYTNRKTGTKKWTLVVREYNKGSRTTSSSGLPAGNKKNNVKCPTCDVIPATDSSPERFTRYDHWIKEASSLYQIPVALIKAVIKAESDFDPRVVSYKGAKGLMQIMPEVQIDMGIKRVFDPRDNILGGTRLLRYNANIFKGDIILTIAAYHAGPNAVKKFKGIPPFKSTRKYVPAVLRYYYYFKNQEKKSVK
ncbi:lytic transglycosylase domain-containing protein [Myxococcota bacterium]|nr:lytic transglycosylase domain-containing protein [Myxococcota bacterium]MBU1382307.1 lytic transglycosylase domain-containing protein [Myxococcota bacterium]MBU1498461.1 lytic transglycosylase domain-containing protein [Myxococcota bacterium]